MPPIFKSPIENIYTGHPTPPIMDESEATDLIAVMKQLATVTPQRSPEPVHLQTSVTGTDRPLAISGGPTYYTSKSTDPCRPHEPRRQKSNGTSNNRNPPRSSEEAQQKKESQPIYIGHNSFIRIKRIAAVELGVIQADDPRNKVPYFPRVLRLLLYDNIIADLSFSHIIGTGLFQFQLLPLDLVAWPVSTLARSNAGY
ncbi:hypothetical protein FQA39_LY15465 [Lamprigera yunnana]|nr:hypothetical protein FQA39_LY15465 [Lamprigera yunnana]